MAQYPVFGVVGVDVWRMVALTKVQVWFRRLWILSNKKRRYKNM